jgi:hypothetical protein
LSDELDLNLNQGFLMRLPLVLLLIGLTACASGGASSRDDAPVVACQVPVASSPQQTWRQVSAEGFTFCVPPSWRQSASNTFRGEGGWIRWGVGQFRPTATATTTVTVPAGQLPLPAGRQNRFSESIGGSIAELWDNELEGTLYTGAQWTRPSVYLFGQSTSPAVRLQQLQIYRTVRFTTT